MKKDAVFNLCNNVKYLPKKTIWDYSTVPLST